MPLDTNCLEGWIALLFQYRQRVQGVLRHEDFGTMIELHTIRSGTHARRAKKFLELLMGTRIPRSRSEFSENGGWKLWDQHLTFVNSDLLAI